MEQRKYKLFEHIQHWHKPRNVNEIHAQEKAQHANVYTIFNEKAAVWLTLIFSTMELFWIVDIFMAVWIIGNSIGFWHFDPMPFPLLLMVINIPQLPLLPLLAIGQAVLSRKQTLQADEAYQTTMHSFSDIEQIMQHLDKQDDAIIEILRRLEGGNNSEPTAKEAAASAITAPFNAVNPGNVQQP